MNRGKFAGVFIALGILGIGIVLGMGFSRTLPLVRSRAIDVAGGRFTVHRDFGSRIGRSIEITIPEMPELPEAPEAAEVPRLSLSPRTRLLRPFASEEIIIQRGLPFTIWGVVRTLVGWVINVAALLLIALGVFLIVRRDRQPVEKSPPKVLNEID